MVEVTSIARNRLFKEIVDLSRDPVPFVTATLLDSNFLECHYVIEGPSDSLYKGGYYYGKLVFPPEYPFKPPAIYMITPNGRFLVNYRLCLSISDYHPKTWNPAWSVGSILTGLLSFMLETTSTVGSVVSSNEMKAKFAENSVKFNLKNETFCHLFLDLTKKLKALHHKENVVLHNQTINVTEV